MSPKNIILSALPILAGMAAADTTPTAAPAPEIVQVYLAVDPQDLVAAVVTANPTMTSYTFTCAPGANCDFAANGGNLTVTNDNTYIMSVNGAAAGTPENNLLVDCTSYNAQSVVCAESQDTVVDGAESTTSMIFTQGAVTMIPLTVTAGQEYLAAASSEAASVKTLTTPTAGAAGSASTGATKTASGTAATHTNFAGRVQASWWSMVGLVSVAALVACV